MRDNSTTAAVPMCRLDGTPVHCFSNGAVVCQCGARTWDSFAPQSGGSENLTGGASSDGDAVSKFDIADQLRAIAANMIPGQTGWEALCDAANVLDPPHKRRPRGPRGANGDAPKDHSPTLVTLRLPPEDLTR